MSKYLFHYGIPKRSGRYPYGSGEDPEQRNRTFLGRVSELKKQGVSTKEIAKGLGTTTTELIRKKSLSKIEQRQSDAALARALKDKGMSNVAIGSRMGKNESSIRAMLKDSNAERLKLTDNVVDVLKKAVDTKNYVDIGSGVERHMGITSTRLRTAVSKLEEQGYKVYETKVEQLGTGKYTRVLALTTADTTFGDLMKNKHKIKMPTDYSEDGGYTFEKTMPIKNIDSKRVLIRYAEDGGALKDGVIELRRGVYDISLGNARYAQVRVGVDGKHYMKGMAVYSDDIPKGKDIIYNTNKAKGTASTDVYKKMEDDPDNPFGSSVRQKTYLDAKGVKQLSTLNIVNEEGDWGKWNKSISSQLLSKQSVPLAKKQLELAYDSKMEEFKMINSLTNPIVRKKLLETFADNVEAASVHLKAASLPRQATQVILPFPQLKDTEVYAPNFNNGERVVLIRYPHGGIFEIPELVVNNKNKEARQTIAQAKDAIGIHPKVAEQLSGADFDGDTVLVIPNDKRLIKTSPPLKALQNFDPKVEYKGYEGMTVMSSKVKAKQMGLVSNLITDMTIKGANQEELARAVKHSMVVIDAQKHKLDYKLSADRNNIAQLKQLYQGSAKAGASTLISRAKSEARVNERTYTIDKETGKKVFRYTGKTYVDQQGRTKLKQIASTKMAETDDAFKLSSGTPMETVYATHANRLKTLAADARKVHTNIENVKAIPEAKDAYVKEIDTLNAKLDLSLRNSPLERRSQLIANQVYKAKIESKPNFENTPEEVKKLKGQALVIARARINPNGKKQIEITPKEWEAIQAGAISSSKLKQILDNTDLDKVKEYSMPRAKVELSSNQQSLIKTMLSKGYTQAEIASRLAVSTSTITKLIE